MDLDVMLLWSVLTWCRSPIGGWTNYPSARVLITVKVLEIVWSSISLTAKECWNKYNEACLTSAVRDTLFYFIIYHINMSQWRHQMETFSALLAICAGNSPVPGEFPTQRPVTPSFDVYFDLRPNKRLNKQSWGWWFETLSPPLWRQRNEKLCDHTSHWQLRNAGTNIMKLV